METTRATESPTVVEPPPGAVVPPPVVEQKRMMKVMVGIDDSDYGFYALKWALENLIKYSGARPVANQMESDMITVVHVLQPFQHFAFPAGPSAVYATTGMVESVRKAQEEAAAGLLSRALHLCKEKMIKAETLLLEGDPKDKICEAAAQMHVDLLVVGSRGLGKFKR
ncbi:hypothetical protein LguiA_014242 [Lonicera macranthoides]